MNNIIPLLELPKTLNQSNENFRWFLDHYEMLIEKYLNKFVAIDHEKVLDSDDNLQVLLTRIREDNKYSHALLIQQILTEMLN
ncbi:MAG: DUF5678 domain-containing protein [Candidatus Nitrosocosmicus sp.]|nr:DUF5678 domain-containing protein [Candidatus Nitrosocosmicus sp.]